MFEDFKENFTRLLEKPIRKTEYGVSLIKSNSGWRVETNSQTVNLLTSSERLEKGKAAQIGEIREWKGQKYKKDGSGKWVPVTEPKSTTKGEDDKENTSSVSEEELSNYARSASTESLKRHSESGDEKMRIAAKNELSRREIEENPENKNQFESNEITEGKNKETPQENKEEVSVESKLESLNSNYKSVVEKLMDTDIYSKPDELHKLTLQQQETARYISRIKEFEGVDQEQAKSEVLKKLNLSTDNELQDFVGDGKVLAVKKSFGSLSFLTEDCYCQRTYDPQSKSVHLDEILLDYGKEKGKGLGTSIFSNQINQIRNSGSYETVELTAAKSDIYNGYYTWAILGFEISDKKNLKQFKETLSSSDNPRIQKCKKLSELVSFKEGAEFWRENGFQFEGKFELKDNSNSMKLLNNYLESKKKQKEAA